MGSFKTTSRVLLLVAHRCKRQHISWHAYTSGGRLPIISWWKYLAEVLGGHTSASHSHKSTWPKATLPWQRTWREYWQKYLVDFTTQNHLQGHLNPPSGGGNNTHKYFKVTSSVVLKLKTTLELRLEQGGRQQKTSLTMEMTVRVVSCVSLWFPGSGQASLYIPWAELSFAGFWSMFWGNQLVPSLGRTTGVTVRG